MARLTEDEFPKSVKLVLAKRVGYRCSLCDCATVGPSDDAVDAVNNVGKACHITAAAEGGPRHDPSLTHAQRSAYANGIWACGKCASLIDNDRQTYTVEKLREYKVRAEQRAKARLEIPGTPDQGALTILAGVAQYSHVYKALFVPAEIENTGASPVTIKRVTLEVNDRTYEARSPLPTLTPREGSWFPVDRLRLQRHDASNGVWFFGWNGTGGEPIHLNADATEAQLRVAVVGRGDFLSQLRVLPLGNVRSDTPRAQPDESSAAAWAEAFGLPRPDDDD